MRDELRQEVISHLEKIAKKEKSETDRFELKISTAKIEQISKSMAGLANNRGGFILIGITDDKEIEGMSDKSKEYFSNLHNATRKKGFAQTFTNMFEPVPVWDSETIYFNDKPIGVIIVSESNGKPIIAKKNSDDATIKEGEIYYHYFGETLKIKYGELNRMIGKMKDDVRSNITKKLMSMASFITSRDVDKIGLLDAAAGTVHGTGKNFILDEELFEKIKPHFEFIEEGEFSEIGGAKTLNVIGNIAIHRDGETGLPIPLADKAIMAIHPFETFLTQNKEIKPLEYIRAACDETTFCPIFYYLFLSGMNAAEIYVVIDSVETRKKQAPIKVKERIKNSHIEGYKEVNLRSLGDKTDEQKRLETIHRKLMVADFTKYVTQDDEKELFDAIHTLDKKDIETIQESLFAKLLELLNKHFITAKDKSPYRHHGSMCKAIRYLDEVLYKERWRAIKAES